MATIPITDQDKPQEGGGQWLTDSASSSFDVCDECANATKQPVALVGDPEERGGALLCSAHVRQIAAELDAWAELRRREAVSS